MHPKRHPMEDTMPPIREVTGPGPTLPPEPLGRSKTNETASPSGAAKASAQTSENPRMAALSAFMQGVGGPVDLAALAHTLIQEGAIRP